MAEWKAAQLHNFVLMRIATLMVALLGWMITMLGGASLVQHTWGEAAGRFALAGLVFVVAMRMDQIGDRMRDALMGSFKEPGTPMEEADDLGSWD